MAIHVRLRKWGNSMAIIVPTRVVEEKGLKENDQILVQIVKEADLSKIHGLIKKRKMTGQEMKDMVRKGWD
jgi:antitoxin component of MazEF toxin-antitoxin module